MKEHEIEPGPVTPDPARARDAEAERPTLVQPLAELMELELEPRPLPRRLEQALVELERALEEPEEGSTRCKYLERAWSPPARADEPSYVGQVIDNRYVVDALIARGGMGVVYRCRHRLIGKKLAVKIIRSDMAQLPDAPRRFLTEAKAASAVGNEHIIDIVDYGTLPDGAAYLVMELLEGIPLSELIGCQRPLPIERIVGIALQVCEGLRAAHDAGIVHRDLKPENIFLLRRSGGDFIKILDFGIAKMAQSTEPHTKKGLIVGTPHYMAPEQAAGVAVDQRGDIYALGVILYELAAGSVPFDASHYMEVLGKHMTEPPPRLLPLPGVPEQLGAGFESIVLRCLAKRPEERFQSMTDVIGALEGLRRRRPRERPEAAPFEAASAEPREAPSRATVAERAALPRSSSVPVAKGSLASRPSRSRRGLVWSAAALSVPLALSIWRLRADDAPEQRSPATRAPAPLTPLPPSTVRVAPVREGAAGERAAPAPPRGSPATRPSKEPANDDALAAPPAVPAAPSAVVELTAGKSVEIEARTRLSLRLAEGGASGAGDGPPSGAPQRRGARDGLEGARKGGQAEASAQPPTAARPPEPDARRREPQHELLNPWPTPALGPPR